MNKKILVNIASLMGVQGIGYIIPLLTLPYLVRVLDPHGYGIYGYTLAIVQYFTLLVDFGFNLSITKKISRNKDDKNKISTIFWNVIACKLLLALIGFILIFIWAIIDPLFSGNENILISAYAIVLGNMIFPVWLFQGKEEMANIAFSNILSKLLVVPAIFIFVTSDADIWLACLLNGLTFIIAGSIGVFLVYKKSWICWIMPTRRGMIDEYKNAWHVFLSTAAINAYTSSITVILGIVTTPTVVGYFVAADKIRLAVQGLIGPISQALYPRINALMIKDKKQAFNTISVLLKVQGGGAFILSLLLCFLSSQIIYFMYGAAYTDSIPVMRVLSWLPFIVAISNVFGYQTLLALGLEKFFSYIVLIGAVIALVIIYPLVVYFQQLGAAVTILITELIVNQLMLFIILKKKIPIFKRTL
ncbi:flippase [Scandinavium manionii]|uniref:flippase n=1 Tax=Scandinavium manionii TaxID=2926520 RepID=UPI0021668457|nr:flippase [Scandinavium manionii]MCS2150036.1 flippase [Scandinavium manionii]